MISSTLILFSLRPQTELIYHLVLFDDDRHVDIVSLVVEVQVPMFLQDLDSSKKRLFEDSMNGPTPDVPIQDIFSLYRRTKLLMGMYKAFVPKYVPALLLSLFWSKLP